VPARIEHAGARPLLRMKDTSISTALTAGVNTMWREAHPAFGTRR